MNFNMYLFDSISQSITPTACDVSTLSAWAPLFGVCRLRLLLPCKVIKMKLYEYLRSWRGGKSLRGFSEIATRHLLNDSTEMFSLEFSSLIFNDQQPWCSLLCLILVLWRRQILIMAAGLTLRKINSWKMSTATFLIKFPVLTNENYFHRLHAFDPEMMIKSFPSVNKFITESMWILEM